MLTVAKITRSAAGGYAEYLDGKARAPELGDYYLKDGERTEAPGRWAAGAERFGLDPEGPVGGEQLRTLMDVRRPDTGEALRRVGATGEAVAALDATFSAPKSVSAVWAVGDLGLRERIERAHETAVDRALAYAIRRVPMLRRRVGQDTVVHEKAAGVVATSWRHTTARAVAEQAPDPQLHSHVLLHAAVRRDGELVAIDSRSWLVHQREVGAAYRTELARELTGLGFEVRRGVGRGGRYFELEGVPQGLLDRWSSRRHQVQAAIRDRLSGQEAALEAIIAEGGFAATEAAEQLEQLHRFDQLSPKEERWMATATRNAKAPVTVEDLDTGWRRTALGLGVSRERIDVLRYQAHATLRPADPEQVLEALTEFDATFPARSARAVALERSAGAPIQAALEQLRALRANEDILVLADGTGTTREHRGRERTVVQIAERLTAARVEPLPAAAPAREAERLDRELAKKGGRLSDEQRAAIGLACGGHCLVVIEGQAGTGKSTTLTGIARAHEACGREILVTSTAALAAQRLANELAENGVTCGAFSTAGLDAAIADGRIELTPASTVIHDEAALASTREQIRLLREVEASGARLIAVGDPRQNQPVGAGGLWTKIEQTTQSAGAHVELTQNQRAQDPADGRDQARFREGRAEMAIRGYAARDRVHLRPDQQRAEDQALDAAHADRTNGMATIVIAQTSNEHLDELNARAQAVRRQHGQLGEDSVPVPGRPYELHPGDQVQIRHTIHHEGGQLRNGTSAVVASVDPRTGAVDLRLADGTEIQLQKDEIAEADLRLAYVQHPFPAQGHTTDTAHLIVTGNATREGAYVALTRARHETHIYSPDAPDRPVEVDRLQELADRVSRTEPELPSIHTPLAHETAIQTALQTTARDSRLDQAADELAHAEKTETRSAERYPEPVADVSAGDTRDRARSDTANELQEQAARTWPTQPARDLDTPNHPLGQGLQRHETLSWEP